MKHRTITARGAFAAGVVLGLLVAFAWNPLLRKFVPGTAAHADQPAPAKSAAPAVDPLKSLEDRLPDQSHAMSDVAYQFSNLWFAGEAENWPLADFFLGETRSHLKWAVRLKPIRQDPQGNKLEMQSILDAVDSSELAPLAKTIEAKDKPRFEAGYRLMIENGCYSCHKTVGKPYLRPRIPEQPREPMINFDPRADWPK